MTTTTWSAPSSREAAATAAAFSAVDRAVGSHTSGTLGPAHALRISSASVRPSRRRAQPERTTARAPADSSLGVPEPNRADGVQLVPAARRVAEHRDDPDRLGHGPSRFRTRSNANSVPITVTTSITAFLPCSFDSPLARRACRPAPRRRAARPRADGGVACTSGASLVYGRARIGSAFAFAAYIPLVASRNGLRSATPIERRSSACRIGAPRSAVPVRLVAVARGEARADGDVARVRAHALEQPAQLVRRMLPVGVDAPAVRVAVLGGVAVALGDRGAQPAVVAERDDLGAVLAGDRGGAVGRSVVDDEDVGVGELPPQLVDHGREALLLVPGGDEDDGVARARHVPIVRRSRSSDEEREDDGRERERAGEQDEVELRAALRAGDEAAPRRERRQDRRHEQDGRQARRSDERDLPHVEAAGDEAVAGDGIGVVARGGATVRGRSSAGVGADARRTAATGGRAPATGTGTAAAARATGTGPGAGAAGTSPSATGAP